MTEQSAVRNQQALDAAEKLATYEWGFTSDIEQEFAPKGLNEDTVRFISAKKGEPEWMLDWRLKAYRAWLEMEEVSWAKLDIPEIDYQDAYYYAAPKQKPKLASLDELDPEIRRTYEKLGIPLEEQKVLAGVEGAPRVAVDAVFDSVSVATTFREELKKAGVIFLSHHRGDPRISGAGEEISRLGRSAARQLLRLPQQRGLFRRHVRLHPRGGPLPDGAVDLFPDQCGKHRTVRADPDRRREGQLRVLPRRLHRADARRESAPRGGRRDLRARGRRGEILDGPELVSGRRRRPRRNLQLRHQARLCSGARSKVSWTQVETGTAITWKYPSCILKGEGSVGEFYSVALTNNRQQADTGTKMVHIGANTRSTIVSKGISAGKSNNTYRGLVRVLPNAENVRNFTQCDSLLLGDKCGAHTVPYIEVKNPTATIEHEATTSKISEDQLFYAMSRGLDQEAAVALIVNGFAREVLKQLPMEFAVEAQKLLGISLEGSVG